MREILGRNHDDTWLYVELQCNTFFGWVSAEYVDIAQGSLGFVPKMDSPTPVDMGDFDVVPLTCN